MKIKLADGTEVDLDDPALKEAISKNVESAVAEATKGLATNKQKILDEKKELSDKLAALTKQWEGMDPEVIKNLVDRMNNDEETKLIAEGKIDEVVERRIDAYKKDAEARITAATSKLEEYETSTNALTNKLHGMMLNDGVRQAAAGAHIRDTATQDAIARAKNVFSVDGDKLVAKDADGNPLIGKDGKSPLTMGEWLDSQREGAPHWFNDPEGAPGSGSKDKGGQSAGGTFTLTRAEAADRSTYKAMKAKALEAGQTVQVVDE